MEGATYHVNAKVIVLIELVIVMSWAVEQEFEKQISMVPCIG